MKIVLVGLNYTSHALELGLRVPDEPIIFLKPATAVVRSGDFIEIPPGIGRVDYEGEIALLIGKRCKMVPVERAWDVVRGIVALNDVTARDLQRKDGQWTRAKSFDTFCPISESYIPTDAFLAVKKEATVTTYLNGEKVQEGSSKDMIFPMEFLVHFVSSVMTLEEGDVISTGTPPGIGPLNRGDKVKVEVRVGDDCVAVENLVL